MYVQMWMSGVAAVHCHPHAVCFSTQGRLVRGGGGVRKEGATAEKDERCVL